MPRTGAAADHRPGPGNRDRGRPSALRGRVPILRLAGPKPRRADQGDDPKLCLAIRRAVRGHREERLARAALSRPVTASGACRKSPRSLRYPLVQAEDPRGLEGPGQGVPPGSGQPGDPFQADDQVPAPATSTSTPARHRSSVSTTSSAAPRCPRPCRRNRSSP